jgi:hypothetical protein
VSRLSPRYRTTEPKGEITITVKLLAFLVLHTISSLGSDRSEALYIIYH